MSAWCDLIERPKTGSYCGIIREGVINQLTHPYNGLPIVIDDEQANMMWEMGMQECHLTQNELLSVGMERFWYKDSRISNEFQYKGTLVTKEYLGKQADLICFQEVHQDNIYLTIVGEPWVIQYINENKKFMAEKPEHILAKEDKMESYKTPCWWTQLDYEYREERFDKDNNRITTIEDYSYGDFIVYDTWDNIRRNRRKPIIEEMIKNKQEQLDRYQERIDPATINLIDIIGLTEYVQKIRTYDGESFYNFLNKTNDFKVIIANTEVGKDLAWAIWKRYRIPELKSEIAELEAELEAF